MMLKMQLQWGSLSIFVENLVNSFKKVTFAKQKLTDNPAISMRNVSEYDAIKIKAVFLYVLNKLGKADKLSALKIIYYANKEHLAKFGRPIIQDDFIAMTYGPVPSFLLDAINRVAGKRNMDRPYVDVLAGSFTHTNKGLSLYPAEKPDLDELSKSDIDCLDNSISSNKDLYPGQLSKKTHQDKAWIDASKANGVMDVLQMAKDSGASDEMLKLIDDHQEFSRFCH